MRPPSPPPIPHFSDHEAHTVAEDIKSETNFSKSVEILLTWLERGECSKRNAPAFFTMIQAANSHVRRLLAEQVGTFNSSLKLNFFFKFCYVLFKTSHEEELRRLKEEYRLKVQKIMTQCKFFLHCLHFLFI